MLPDRTVGAGDGVVAGARVPRGAKGDCFPLCDGAAELNARQTATFIERVITNARHAVGNGDTRQTAATVERRITNARHAVGNGNARQTAATVERRRTNA